MFSQYRSLTSTPVIDKNEDSSVYREHESCFTVGVKQVRVLVRTPSILYENIDGKEESQLDATIKIY
jgi:hypothetical protein